jgi:hypothetical protein
VVLLLGCGARSSQLEADMAWGRRGTTGHPEQRGSTIIMLMCYPCPPHLHDHSLARAGGRNGGGSGPHIACSQGGGHLGIEVNGVPTQKMNGLVVYNVVRPVEQSRARLVMWPVRA